jgi:epoxyqueuosine reductase QueG
MGLSAELKKQARLAGADLVGVAGMARFANAEREGGINPSIYLEDGKSVIVIGCRITRGTRDVAGPYLTDDKTYGPYLWYGYGYLNFFLSEIAYRVSRWLEGKGYRAVPFVPTGAASMYRRYEGFLSTEPDRKFSADISHRHAAVAAGLGELGLNGLFLSPEFGSRQRLVSIVTSAPLEEDPVYAGPALCRKDKCGICLKKCPSDAYRRDDWVHIEIAGKKTDYVLLDYQRCLYGVAGFLKKGGARSDVKIKPRPATVSREDWARDRAQRTIIDQMITQDPIHMNLCGLCLLSCPAPWPAGKKKA